MTLHTSGMSYARAALDRECEDVARTASGRNSRLNVAGFNLGQFVGAGALTEDEVERRLFDAAMSNGYVAKDGAEAARNTIHSGLSKGILQPRELPADQGAANGYAKPDHRPPSRPRPSRTANPIPDWRVPDPITGKPAFEAIGQDEPLSVRDEVRRHLYRRAGTPVHVKIKRADGGYLNFYRVRRPSDGAVGWQARKPPDYVLTPYIGPQGAADPFAPAHVAEPLFWPEGEKDVDTLQQLGCLAFTCGGASDVPPASVDLVRGRHLIVLGDNDAPGEQCVERKIKLASGSAAQVEVIRFPDLPAAGDVSDWAERTQGTVQALRALAKPVAALPPLDSTPGGQADARTGEAAPELNANGFSMQRMNSEFAFILVGSKAVILRERPNAPVEERTRLLTIEAFRAWSANRWTEFWDEKGKLKRTRFADAWMMNQSRREYDGMEFHPDPENAPGTDNYFNLWRGFAIKPKAKVNGYAVLRDHLLNNICNGDPTLYAWVFGYLAHTVQRPRERTGTALVFRGGMGAGKTIVGAAVGSLFPSHYFLVDDPRYLTGQFNSHMAQCLLLQADEAVWAGDKHAEGRLKGLITSTEQMIEAKGVDPVRLKNYVRIVMTSNEDWVVPAGKDERRFCVLDVNPRCAQLHEYFGEMEAELANGGREALLHDLLAFDLSGINLRQIPRTEALLEQKVHSLDSVDSWWLDRLTSGTITASSEDWSTQVTRGALFLDYVTAADRVGVRRKVDPNVFGKRMGKLAPGLRKIRPRPSSATYEPGGHNRPWRYVFPSLAVCREAFETALKQPVAWPEEEDESG